MAPNAATAPAKSPADSPYKLEPSQVLKASQALLKHMRDTRKQNENSTGKKNLLATGNKSDDDDEEEEGDDAGSGDSDPVWLVFTTKKHITNEKSLKPKKIAIPHTLNVSSAVSSVCLITPDPQRAFKDVIQSATFPEELRKKIVVHGVDKIKSRYKSFEQRRQLRDEHDVFLADERIITMLPKLIGKILYGSTAKRPLPVNLAAPRPKDAEGKTIKAEKKINSNKRVKGDGEPEVSVAKPEVFAREIERALSSAQVHLSPSVTTAIRLGFDTFSAKQLAENIEAVVKGMVDGIIPKGWRNVKSVHIKGPNSTALPIWLSSELWADDADIIEDEDAEKAKALESQQGRKRKTREADPEPEKKQKRLESGLSSGREDGFSKEMTERREKLRQQKRAAKVAIGAEA